MSELTPRQVRELDTAVRHLGRAMKAFDRAHVPLGQMGESAVFMLNTAEGLTQAASNKLIDGLELL